MPAAERGGRALAARSGPPGARNPLLAGNVLQVGAHVRAWWRDAMELELTQEARSQVSGATEGTSADTAAVEAEAAELIETLECESRRKTIRFWVLVTVFVAVQVCLVTAVNRLWLNSHGGAFSYFFYLIAVALAAHFAPTARQKRAARSLAACDDPRAAGPLCLALTRQDSPTRRLAADVVARLLPLLAATPRPSLTEDQLRALHDAVTDTEDGNEKLALAVAEALPVLGDRRFLDWLGKLAVGQGLARRSPRLKAAGQAALPLLQERVERLKAAETLLRPAESAETGGDALLRPAGPGEPDPERLLRPA